MNSGFYLGYREDPDSSCRLLYTVKNYRVSRNDGVQTVRTGLDLRMDYCAVALSDKSYTSKNRMTTDDTVMPLPYRDDHGKLKNVQLNPKARPEAFKSLVSWILEQSIDLNSINKVDEFTLLMLAE